MDLHANRFPPEGRSGRLSPGTVADWTARIVAASRRLAPGERPCDYGPWEQALAEVGAPHGAMAGLPEWWDTPAGRLMHLAEDIAQPRWPEPRRDLIGFALAFLEADVMLFRSGYAKARLLTRLRQVPLEATDLVRIGALLRRAVDGATGLEEFREWCRLAGHLAGGGGLADLRAWLKARAEGAVLTSSMGDVRVMRRILSAELSEKDRGRLLAWSGGRSDWGVEWPGMERVVPAGERLDAPRQRLARDAWRMLAAMGRRGVLAPETGRDG